MDVRSDDDPDISETGGFGPESVLFKFGNSPGAGVGPVSGSKLVFASSALVDLFEVLDDRPGDNDGSETPAVPAEDVGGIAEPGNPVIGCEPLIPDSAE